MNRSVPIVPVQAAPLRMVVVEVTTWCNLKCPGCNRTIGENAGNWNNRHMSLDDFRRIAANLPPAGQIVLHGVGEPTMNPQYLGIIREARRGGKFGQIVCITNALARTPDFYAEMIRAGMDSFTVSVDSLNEEVADRTRTGTPVGKLADRLAEFRAHNLPFSVSMVASRLNLDDIPHTLEKLDELGVPTIHLQPFIEFGDLRQALDREDLVRLLERIGEIGKRLRQARINATLLERLLDTGRRELCAAPWLEPAVTVDGYLTPCCVKMDPEPLGRIDLKSMSFAAAQATPSYRRFLADYCDASPAFCRGCFNDRRPVETRPLVSVTFVAFNHSRYVRAALESVLAQTYSPLEIVISDDASTDDTAGIIESCLAGYTGPHRTIFLKQPENLGAKGRNNLLAAFRAATGRFIVWFCGDDVMRPTQVERMVDVWQREGKTLVTVNADYIDADSAALGRSHRDPHARPNTSVENLARDGANDCNFGAGMGFARAMLEAFPFDETNPPPHLPPDLIFPFYAGLLNGCAMIPEPLMLYRVHGAQTSVSLAHESETDAIARLLIEKQQWLGHLGISRYMAATLDRAAATDPVRFGPARERLLPLVMHQTTLMSDRLLAVVAQLAAAGYVECAPPTDAARSSDKERPADELLAEAVQIVRGGDLAGAAEAGRAAMLAWPADARFPYLMALIMKSAGQIDIALDMMQAALELDPENEAYRQELADWHAQLLQAAQQSATPAVPAADAGDLDALTNSPAIDVYFIDISDECNLRCVYCHQSAPDFQGRAMEAATLDEMREMLVRHPPRTIAYLSSGGEATTLAEWTTVAARFLDQGTPCGIISNFARLFTPDEIGVLTRLSEILISIDTVDPALTKAIRRKSDIRTILFNHSAVRAHCALHGIAPPRIVWNVVCYDLSLMNSPALAAAAVAYRPDSVTFAQLKPIPGVVAPGVRAVTELPPDERNACADALRRATTILADNGIEFSVNEELKIELGLAPPPGHGVPAPGKAPTRDCLMPWEFFLTHSDGSVKPCCNAEKVTIGQIRPGEDPFAAVFNGPEMRAWRCSMLTGDLTDACRTCTAYPLTTTDRLRIRVADRLTRCRK